MTCPVYHRWVSELKASVLRCGKREVMSLTSIIRPLDTCLTRIWIEGEFLEENKSFDGNLAIQSKHSFLEPCLRDTKNSFRFLVTSSQRLHLQSKKGHTGIRSCSCSRGSYCLLPSAGPSLDPLLRNVLRASPRPCSASGILKCRQFLLCPSLHKIVPSKVTEGGRRP